MLLLPLIVLADCTVTIQSTSKDFKIRCMMSLPLMCFFFGDIHSHNRPVLWQVMYEMMDTLNSPQTALVFPTMFHPLATLPRFYHCSSHSGAYFKTPARIIYYQLATDASCLLSISAGLYGNHRSLVQVVSWLLEELVEASLLWVHHIISCYSVGMLNWLRWPDPDQ